MRRPLWFLVGLLASLTSVFAPLVGEAPTVRAQANPFPKVDVSAVQLADSVRYGVQLLPRDADEMLRDVRVEVTLPAGADLVEALETPGYTQFGGRQGDRLSWTANFVANDYIDPFSFRLRQAASGPLNVQVRWGGSAPGEATVTAQPTVEVARATEGEVTLGPEGTPRLLTAGETGVSVGIAAGVVTQPTRVQVRRLGPETNPPPAAGDLWWCAALELSGLPAGTTALVTVPTRQVLPEGTEVTLFARRGDTWAALPDKGIAIDGGQRVLFTHPGGTIAAGTTGAIQVRPGSSGSVLSATPTPRPGQPAPGANVSTTSRVLDLGINDALLRRLTGNLPLDSGVTAVPFSATTDTLAEPGSCSGRPLCSNGDNCTPEMMSQGFVCVNAGGGLTICGPNPPNKCVGSVPGPGGIVRICSFTRDPATGATDQQGRCRFTRTGS